MCSSRRIVSEPLVQVDVCGCGKVHLHLGPISVRVDRQAPTEVADALRRAVVRLAAHPDNRWARFAEPGVDPDGC